MSTGSAAWQKDAGRVIDGGILVIRLHDSRGQAPAPWRPLRRGCLITVLRISWLHALAARPTTRIDCLPALAANHMRMCPLQIQPELASVPFWRAVLVMAVLPSVSLLTTIAATCYLTSGHCLGPLLNTRTPHRTPQKLRVKCFSLLATCRSDHSPCQSPRLHRVSASVPPCHR